MENVKYYNGRQVLVLVAGAGGGGGKVIDVYNLHTIQFILFK